MIPQQFKRFIPELIASTNQEKIKWEQEGEGRFVGKTKSVTISLNHHFDENEEMNYYYFYYKNVMNGRTAQFRVAQDHEDFKTMEALANAAQISANNIGDDLEDFFENL